MKYAILVTLAILGTQGAEAANLRYMVLDEKKSTFYPTKDEKIVMISASNVNGAAFVNIGSEGSLCVVSVANLAEAAAAIAAVSGNTTVECYTRVPVQTKALAGPQNLVTTKEIMIIKGGL